MRSPTTPSNPGASQELSDEDISRLFGALSSSLKDRMGFTDAVSLLARAGLSNLKVGGQFWAPLLSAAERVFFNNLRRDAQITALQILAEGLLDNQEDDEVRRLLQRHGFEFVVGEFVPVALLDAREAAYVPSTSASELAKAMQRLVSGDESGAITSACGAVDLVTGNLYQTLGLGNPGHASFSTKVNMVLGRLGVYPKMRQEFEERGMRAEEAEDVIRHIKRATNHAAQALQILRREMGDAHGTRRALRQTAYDAIKWAASICALMEIRQ